MTKMTFLKPSYFFKGQLIHLISLILLIVFVFFNVDYNRLSEIHFCETNAKNWLIITLLIPILHQVYVWLAWRSELCFGFVTNNFGSKGFLLYRILFFLLFISRPTPLIFLSIADHDSFKLDIASRIIICTLFAIPAGYTFYSVIRYFGMSRASGADHFDEKFRHLPMVNDGIFRFSSNSMYTFAFLLFWIIPVAGASWSGLVAVFFSHAYIWVHYFCTERPDMKVIYG